MSSEGDSAARSLSTRETVLAVAGLMLTMFLVSLDQTIVGTAMPRIVVDLKGFELYAWVTTAYLLAETAVIPIVGKLGDLYGRKWITIAGVAVFLIGSALCGLAGTMPQLIAFRGVQGIGAGIILATTFTLIADIFPDPARRAKYQGVFFSVFAVSSVIGPFLGGWITDGPGWRWVFYVNLPLGLFALTTLPRTLPTSRRRADARIDYLGAFTITTAVVALLLAVSWIGAGQPWTSGRVIAGLAIAAISFAAFVPIELRAAEPILPFTLFRNRTFSAISLVMFMIGIGMFGVILYTPLFVQGVLGQTATGSGAVLTPLVLTMTAMGIVGGQLIARFRRVKPFLLFGTVMMSLGVLLLSTLDVGSSTTTVAFYLFVTALGLGLVMPTTTLAVQSAVEPEVLGVVTSSTQFIRSVGATVGTAIIGTLVTGGYVNQLTANAPAGTPPNLVESLRNPDVLVSEQALRELSRAASALPNGAQLVDSLLGVARSALAGSIREGFWFVLAGTVLAFFATLLMPDLRLEQRPATAMPPEGATAGGSATAATASASTAAIPEAGPVRTNGDSAPIGRRTPVERTH